MTLLFNTVNSFCGISGEVSVVAQTAEYSVLLDAFRPFSKALLILSVVVLIGITLDYLTGSIAARKLGEWSSKTAREGIWHKVGILIAMLIAVLLDAVTIVAVRTVGLSITYYGLFSPLVALFYAVTELGSIVENLAKMGTPVPQFLTNGIAALKHEVDKKADEQGMTGRADRS